VKNEARALRGDLDNIVLKALRREPDRRYASVGALAEEAIAVSPENSDVIAGARNYLALVLEKKGRYQEATQLLRSTAEISASNEGTDSPSYLTAMHNLAGALSDLGNLSEAEATERKVLEIRQRVSGRGHPDTAYSLNMLGWILLEKGDWAAADPYLIASVIKIAAVTLALCRPMNFPVRYRQLSEAA
jgi:tetratricopeptide (TPR) repeat protein